MIRMVDNAERRFNEFDKENDFVTTEEACEILGLHRSQARVLLGEPDRVWQSANGNIQYVFDRKRVFEIKKKREERRIRMAESYGKRGCYYCRNLFNKSELVAGICPSCQARKLVRNFICKGDCCRNTVDMNRLKLLSDAIDAIRETLSESEIEHGTCCHL